MASTSGRYRVGIDIGGTFTDFFLHNGSTGEFRLHKCLTTPGDPSAGALNGLDELLKAAGIGYGDLVHLVHGTTLVTNALIERRGAKTALLTTRGFRDILEMGIEQRYDIHDLFLTFPEALAPRALRREINERLDHNGNVVTALDLDQVRRELRFLAGQKVQAVAVCFIHAYKNPVHEKAVKALIEREFAEFSVSISSEVQPEIREYERTSTTVANAYVQPLMDSYVSRLDAELIQRGFKGKFHMMQSSGGLASPKMAAEFPVRLLESGPAGGALVTSFFGGRVGMKDVISFDMGGTTAKACLIQNGRADIGPLMEAARVHRFKKGSGIPIKAPVIDMIEIGAGGGSIARIDSVGLLKVGPESAGAVPGPACYGQGGTEPTVTDANLMLGYLDPGFFLGGRMKLDRSAAERAVASVAKPLKLSTIEAAWGIYNIVCEGMAAAARVHIVEKGRDPRRYSFVAMGGAGPAHAARVARILGVSEVLVPPASGAASALGFLVAPTSFEYIRSYPCLLDDMDSNAVNKVLADLEAEGRTRLKDAGVDPKKITVMRSAEMRLSGQMHEITVPLPNAKLGAKNLVAVKKAFSKEYSRLYTKIYQGTKIQAVNWRVLCSGPVPSTRLARQAGKTVAQAARKGSRRAYFPESKGYVEATIYDRYSLKPGARVKGPAIIEESEATTIIPPGDFLTVDKHLNLRIAIGGTKKLKAVVSSKTPLKAAIAKIEADPIGLEIMWSRLINIAEECWTTVIRTAFSLIIGEAQDFACEILDGTGKQLVHSPRAMPVFNLTLPIAVQSMIEKYPPDKLKPGDVLITNDPWKCAGHLFDIAIATPVFHKGKIVAIVGNVGHVADIGGTKDSFHARELYEEGLQIPPLKLFIEGKPNEDVFAMIAENVRNNDQVLGDIHALVSANMVGAQRILEFIEEYGMYDLEALAAVIQGRAERAMRAAIRRIPDGVYKNEVWNNSLGERARFPIKITVKGDELEVDFEGAPPVAPRGGINCTLSYTKAHASYPLKCLLSPEVPGNEGSYRPLTIKAPENSIMNAPKPAAVNVRTHTGWYVAPNVFMALAPVAAKQVQAFTGLPWGGGFYGIGADGKVYNDHLFQGGGQGASAFGDGKSALMFPTSAANTSVEVFEVRTPTIVLDKAYITDSAGPGKQRGGFGQYLRVRKLENDGRSVLGSFHPMGVDVKTPGLFKGKAGHTAQVVVRDPKGDILSDLGPGALISLTTPNQIVELRLGGGSGFGDPLERPIEAVQRDLDGGYITAEAATRDYGCVVGAEGVIDASATERTRETRLKTPQPAE
ncbi:MAG: methylhydantoinase [Rhodospirillales bacterium]|nr:methylhydantoinase [Rhodospirillales bacterium]